MTLTDGIDHPRRTHEEQRTGNDKQACRDDAKQNGQKQRGIRIPRAGVSLVRHEKWRRQTDVAKSG
jgi:hypothetical protein